MAEDLYAATDANGVQRLADGKEILWSLPDDGDLTAGEGIVLLEAPALLEELGERIFVARAEGSVEELPGGAVRTSAARLLAECAWDDERAASFALDCAEHVLGAAGAAVLPGGETLESVLAEARGVLARSSEHAEERLGTIARLAAARRLRRRGDELGDVALGTLSEDLDRDLDALDDPSWATIAAARDGVLAAVEAVRHLALPRYIEARERAFTDGGVEAGGAREVPSQMIVTPWGPITLGAEHQSGFVPAWFAARDAAARAREARGDAADEERAWQAAHLVEILRPS